MSDPCKRCGGPDDHNHDLTDCVARLTVDRRELTARLAAATALYPDLPESVRRELGECPR